MAELVLTSISGARGINSETYTTQIYNLLRSSILKRELKEGEVYSQDQISSMLNISRTPVREALLALQKEGYIRFLRGRGFEVVPCDMKDIGNIAETRLIVEKAAAGLAALRATDAQVAAMGENIAQQEACVATSSEFNVEFYLQLDDKFHQQILEASCNSSLYKVTEDMRSQWMRVGYSILQYGDGRRESCSEHREVYEAIKTHDAAAAEKAMAKHMNNTQKRHLKKDILDT